MTAPRPRMRPGQIVAAVFGSLGVLVSLALVAGGTALVVIHGTQRDAAGYYHSDTVRLETTTYAITSEHLDLGSQPSASSWATALGTVRLQATAASENGVFIGIAPTSLVRAYLAGSSYDMLTDVAKTRPFTPVYQRFPGTGSPAPPATQRFWVASASGTGQQTLYWDASGGDWTIVAMNADASQGVSIDAAAGLRTGVLLPVGIGLLVAGVVFGGVAAALLVIVFRTRGPGQVPPGTPAPEPAPVPAVFAGSYPMRLDARLEEDLSRWRWLVKWLLVIPHLFVLAFLWLAFAVLTVVAGFSILFTGRYPRGIFDFNVGVLRWTWRVTYYATTLGTDRYPPFTLEPDPTYPADLQVDYPERLSRGLVLVKWWLLAIPHYIIISIFGGGLTWWTWSWDTGHNERYVVGFGLVGILVLVAGITLAVTSRYPRQVYDFVLGMQRWTYRVMVYAALMRDEYPPFRLDNGGTDPATVPPPSPPPIDGRSASELVHH